MWIVKLTNEDEPDYYMAESSLTGVTFTRAVQRAAHFTTEGKANRVLGGLLGRYPQAVVVEDTAPPDTRTFEERLASASDEFAADFRNRYRR